LKKSQIAVIVVVILAVVGVSAYWFGLIPNYYNNGGVAFFYPSNWNVTYQKYNNTSLTLMLKDTKSSKTFSVINKQKNFNDVSFDVFKTNFLDLYIRYVGNSTILASNSVTVSGVNGYDTAFQVNNSSTVFRIVLFEKNNYFYVISLVSQANIFNTENTQFNMIVNTFQVT
jgi:hypothetical protein